MTQCAEQTDVAHMNYDHCQYHTVTPFLYGNGVYFTGGEWEWRKPSSGFTLYVVVLHILKR